MRVIQTSEFNDWYKRCSLKDRAQIDARIAKIEEFEHFGDWKNLGEGLAELRWKSGRRVYFTKVGVRIILLLSGGLKNAQKKDIKKARQLIGKYADT